MSPDNNVQQEIELLEQRFAENSQGLVFAHLADAYRRAGEFAKAEGLILHGLKNHPNYTSAYNVLGRVYLDSERFEEAQEQFSKVLDLDPDNLAALRALADLAERDGRLADARGWYERMLQVDPRSEEAKAGLTALQPEAAGYPSTDAVIPESTEPSEPSVDFGFEPEAERFAMDVEGVEDEGEEVALQPSDARSGWPAFDHDLDAEIDDAFAAAEAGGLSEEGEAAEIGEPPTTEAEAESEPVSELAGAESFDIDFGIMEDWTPGLLDREDNQVAAEPGETAEAGATPETGVGGFFEELDDGFTLELGGKPTAGEVDEFEPAGREAPGEGMVTETMAKLYAEQGLHEDALRVYRQLAEARPDDEDLAARIRELEDQLAEPAPASGGDAEELAELLELTGAGEPVAAEYSSSAQRTNSQGAEDDGFVFEDEAPVAGLEHLDPFAASFEVFAMKEEAPAAPPMEVAEAGEPAEEALEGAGEEVTPEPMVTPTGGEITEEPQVIPTGLEIASDEMADVIPVAIEPQPLAEEMFEEQEEPAAAAPQAEGSTIEEYLATLLAFDPRAAEAEAPEATSGEAPGGPEGAGPDDLEKFQEWLRSLKR